jgi:hypothetical protein
VCGCTETAEPKDQRIRPDKYCGVAQSGRGTHLASVTVRIQGRARRARSQNTMPDTPRKPDRPCGFLATVSAEKCGPWYVGSHSRRRGRWTLRRNRKGVERCSDKHSPTKLSRSQAEMKPVVLRYFERLQSLRRVNASLILAVQWSHPRGDHTVTARDGGALMPVEMLTYAMLGERLNCSPEAARALVKRLRFSEGERWQSPRVCRSE